MFLLRALQFKKEGMPGCLGPAAAPVLDALGTGGAKCPPGRSLRDTHWLCAPRAVCLPRRGAGPGRAGAGAGMPGRCVSSPRAELRRLLPPCEPLPSELVPSLAAASAGQDLLFTGPHIRGLGVEPRQDPWAPRGPVRGNARPGEVQGGQDAAGGRLGRESCRGGSRVRPSVRGRGRHRPPQPPPHSSRRATTWWRRLSAEVPDRLKHGADRSPPSQFLGRGVREPEPCPQAARLPGPGRWVRSQRRGCWRCGLPGGSLLERRVQSVSAALPCSWGASRPGAPTASGPAWHIPGRSAPWAPCLALGSTVVPEGTSPALPPPLSRPLRAGLSKTDRSLRPRRAVPD